MLMTGLLVLVLAIGIFGITGLILDSVAKVPHGGHHHPPRSWY